MTTEELAMQPCERKGYECTDIGFIQPLMRSDLCPSCLARSELRSSPTQPDPDGLEPAP